jgi:hypothetical protein
MSFPGRHVNGSVETDLRDNISGTSDSTYRTIDNSRGDTIRIGLPP